MIDIAWIMEHLGGGLGAAAPTLSAEERVALHEEQQCSVGFAGLPVVVRQFVRGE